MTMIRLTAVHILFAALLALPVAGADFRPQNAKEFQQALNVAARNGEDDFIALAAAVYDVTANGSAPFTIFVADRRSVTIEGRGPGVTILDGASKAAVLEIGDPIQGTSTVTLRSVSIRNARGFALTILSGFQAVVEDCLFTGSDTELAQGYDALVYIWADASIIFERCVIASNRVSVAGRDAKSIVSAGSPGTVRFRDNSFLDNEISSPDAALAGGILQLGAGLTLSFDRTTFERNRAVSRTPAPGLGGIAFVSGQRLQSATFTGNDVQAEGPVTGGVLFASGVTALDDIVVRNSSVSARSVNGGAVSLSLEGQPVVTNISLTGNEVTGGRMDGGVLSIDSKLSSTMTGLVIHSNRVSARGNGAIVGGVVRVRSHAHPSLLRFDGNAVIDNEVSSEGGQVYGGAAMISAVDRSVLRHNTIARNEVPSAAAVIRGRGLYSHSGTSQELVNNIIWENGPRGAAEIHIGAPGNGELRNNCYPSLAHDEKTWVSELATLAIDPHLSPSPGDFRLRADSPAAAAGEGGATIGAAPWSPANLRAVDDFARTTPGTAVSINVTENDRVDSGDPIALIAVSTTWVGRVECIGPVCTYTPPASFTGTAEFTCTVAAGAETSSAVAYVEVSRPRRHIAR